MSATLSHSKMAGGTQLLPPEAPSHYADIADGLFLRSKNLRLDVLFGACSAEIAAGPHMVAKLWRLMSGTGCLASEIAADGLRRVLRLSGQAKTSYVEHHVPQHQLTRSALINWR